MRDERCKGLRQGENVNGVMMGWRAMDASFHVISNDKISPLEEQRGRSHLNWLPNVTTAISRCCAKNSLGRMETDCIYGSRMTDIGHLGRHRFRFTVIQPQFRSAVGGCRNKLVRFAFMRTPFDVPDDVPLNPFIHLHLCATLFDRIGSFSVFRNRNRFA